MTRNGRTTAPLLGEVLSLARPAALHWNCPPARLVTEALRRNEASLAASGALVAETGRFTGRSPEDRYIVDRPGCHEAVDWGAVNQPLAPDRFDGLLRRAVEHLAGRELFVQDLWAGAAERHRLAVRVVTEQAWHNLFARNMFRRPPAAALDRFEPEWTVLQLPSLGADPKRDGTASETAIALDFERRVVLIVGTAYAGEIKKSIFSVLNFILPDKGVMPMHCSANEGADGDVAIFFGLSGTGKTTLSADASRRLIGDDEHGWDEDGVFNFEGGCYAKVIRLEPDAEPEIWAASNRFGAVLENVILDPVTLEPCYDDATRTENTRSSYPLEFIANAQGCGSAGHPRHIVMLTADAFGVLPPISLLTPEQAMYHFLSGYTARVAGTERGVAAPQATFSTCFGAPFMPRHPGVYASLLGRMMRRHDVRCWLLNTGWTGGAYGTGKRMPLAATRTLLRAALDGRLESAPMREHPTFGLRMPTSCAKIDGRLLDPQRSWRDAAGYDRLANELAQRFQSNFERFAPFVGSEVNAAAIHAAP